MHGTVLPYTIVVPSRSRHGLIPGLLAKLPGALICVEESERDEYLQTTPAEQLWLHPPLHGMAKIRNWIIDNAPTDVTVQIDDDFRRILSYPWRRRRKITSPGSILTIIENGVNLAHDLGTHVFCWGRSGMNTFYSNCDPFGVSRLISCSFVILGRENKFDEAMVMNADLDFTLQMLLKDRVVLRDERFYFDHGGIASGRGGAQALRTSEVMDAWKLRMKEKWGRYVKLDRKPMVAGTRNTRGDLKRSGVVANRIIVPRKNNIGSK